MSKRDRIREEARTRWGDAWTLHITEWADGSQQVRAFHSRGLDESGEFVLRDELYLTPEGDVVVDRVAVREERRVVDAGD